MPPNAGKTAAEIVFWLEHEPMSVRELATRLGFTQEAVRYHVKNLLAQKRIHAHYRARLGDSYCKSVRYAAGQPKTAAQLNPFLTAACLIAAPSGQTGRIYQQHD